MPAILVADKTMSVGTRGVLEAPSPGGRYTVIFEDDGDTGYFYGLDAGREDNPICDALHIYDAESVSDRDRPSLFQIGWSGDALKTVLLINGVAHAVFDFEAKRGYCRTNFPPPDTRWTRFGHEWDEAVVASLFS